MERDLGRRIFVKGVAAGGTALLLDPLGTMKVLADGQGSDVVQLPKSPAQPEVIDQVGPNGGAASVTTIESREYTECGILVNDKAQDTGNLYKVTESLVQERGSDGRLHLNFRWLTDKLHFQPNPCANNK